MRKLFGLLMLLIGIIILAFSLVGAYYIGDAIASLAEGARTSLDLAAQSLMAAGNTLTLARDTVRDVHGGLDSAVGATSSAALTLSDSRPMVDNVSAVTTQEVPEAIEGVQAALPNMIQVAAVIDRTLSTLSSVGIDRDIPLPFGGSIPLRFDLGIDYNPTTSFDESLRVFEASLEGLPDSLRGLEDDLRATSENLAVLSNDLQLTSDNLTTINTRIGEILSLLDQYASLVDELSLTVELVRANLDAQLNLLRIGGIALLLAIGLSQLAPIYLGWELLAGRRGSPPEHSQPLQPVVVAPIAVPVSDEPLTVTSPGKENDQPAETPYEDHASS